jgi:hypothetical protein
MSDEKQYFSTRDLYMATSLISLGFSMTQIDYQVEGERRLPVGYFQFENNSALIETLNKYRQGQLLIEPRTFSTNLRALKSEITNQYKNPHNNSDNN